MQPGWIDYAHLITTGTPRFSDLPMAKHNKDVISPPNGLKSHSIMQESIRAKKKNFLLKKRISYKKKEFPNKKKNFLIKKKNFLPIEISKKNNFLIKKKNLLNILKKRIS